MKKAFMISLMVLVVFTAQLSVAQTTECEARLKQKTEQLYQNYGYLKELYRSLYEMAELSVYESDRELDYIQKSYMLVKEANLICYYQYKLLSIMEYIRDDAKSDYYKLRIKDLDKAEFDTKHTIRLIDLYTGFIKNEKVLKSVEDAIGIIQANIYMYVELMDILQQSKEKP
ncbi:hypothetical protein ACFL9U_07180 [Thermodesulfobacteriota bacterium]